MESRQVLVLHANQTGKFRELFVHWSQEKAFTDPPTHKHTYRKEQSSKLPPIHPSRFSAPSWLSRSTHSPTLFFLSWFLLSCSRYVCSFQAPSIFFVHFASLFVFVRSLGKQLIYISLRGGRARWSLRGSDSLHFRCGKCADDGCLAKNTQNARTYTYTHRGSRDQTQPDLAPAEEEEYQTTGSFFCWGIEKHGCHGTAGALLERTRGQPTLRFHSHVRKTVFMIIKWCGKMKQFCSQMQLGLALLAGLCHLQGAWQHGECPAGQQIETTRSPAV